MCGHQQKQVLDSLNLQILDLQREDMIGLNNHDLFQDLTMVLGRSRALKRGTTVKIELNMNEINDLNEEPASLELLKFTRLPQLQQR